MRTESDFFLKLYSRENVSHTSVEIAGTRVEIIHAGVVWLFTRTHCLRLEPRYLFSYDSS